MLLVNGIAQEIIVLKTSYNKNHYKRIQSSKGNHNHKVQWLALKITVFNKV